MKIKNLMNGLATGMFLMGLSYAENCQDIIGQYRNTIDVTDAYSCDHVETKFNYEVGVDVKSGINKESITYCLFLGDIKESSEISWSDFVLYIRPMKEKSSYGKLIFKSPSFFEQSTRHEKVKIYEQPRFSNDKQSLIASRKLKPSLWDSNSAKEIFFFNYKTKKVSISRKDTKRTDNNYSLKLKDCVRLN